MHLFVTSYLYVKLSYSLALSTISMRDLHCSLFRWAMRIEDGSSLRVGR